MCSEYQNSCLFNWIKWLLMIRKTYVLLIAKGLNHYWREINSSRNFSLFWSTFRVCMCACVHTSWFNILAFADWQVSQCEQTNGTVQVSEPDRGADQDMVPESSHKVEKAADVAAQDRTEARTLSADVLPDHTVPSPAILRGTFDVWQPVIRRREL